MLVYPMVETQAHKTLPHHIVFKAAESRVLVQASIQERVVSERLMLGSCPFLAETAGLREHQVLVVVRARVPVCV